ncbi:hypothetical protein [Thalassobaculum sp.]|uniref:tetratricopeptide repeat protein n=1 Tax=Thalassobaculum sp. TaxID=2022740 RepID=UPI0032ED8DCC
MDPTKQRAETDPLKRAHWLLQGGEFTRARHCVRRALMEQPSSAPALTLAGQISVRTQDVCGAVRYFMRASRVEHHADPRAYLNLARIQEMAGNADAALATAQQAADLFSQDVRPRALLALLHLSAGSPDAAIATLRDDDVGRIDPDTAYKIGSRLSELPPAQAGKRAVAYLARAAAAPGRFLEQALQDLIETAPPDDPRRYNAARRLLALNPAALDAIDALDSDLGRGRQPIRHAAWVWQACCLVPGDLRRLARAGELTHRVKWPNHGIAANTLLLREAPNHLGLINRTCELFCRLKELEPNKDVAVQRARHWVESVVATKPADPRVWDSLAGLYKNIEAYDLATKLWPEIVKQFPVYHALHYNYGLFLDEQERTAEAFRELKRALVLKPDYQRASNLMSMVHTHVDDIHAAVHYVKWAIATRPKRATCWVNYGTYVRTLGDYGEAVNAFQYAEILAKDDNDKDMEASARFNTGMSMLMIGELETGFNRIEARWATPGFPSPKRNIRLPIWRGPNANPDSKLLTFMEQGMGDEIMLSWYLPLLRRDTRRLVVDCDPRLVDLLARTYEGIEFIPRSLKGHPTIRDPGLRFKVPMLHVPQHYVAELKFLIRDNWDWTDRRGERFPARLTLEPARLERWHRWLNERYPGRPRLALSWRSKLRNRNRNQQYLSVEELAAAIPAGTVAVNLQYSSTDEEKERLYELGQQLGFEFVTPEGVDLTNDLEDVLALLQVSDAAVTPMISLAWMAGAVGCPAYVFRSSRERVIWQQFGTPFVPWAPSMRLFFRDPSERWDAVVTDLRTRLSSFLVTQPGPSLN